MSEMCGWSHDDVFREEEEERNKAREKKQTCVLFARKPAAVVQSVKAGKKEKQTLAMLLRNYSKLQMDSINGAEGGGAVGVQ